MLDFEIYFEANNAMHDFCTSLLTGVEQIISCADFTAAVQANHLLLHLQNIWQGMGDEKVYE